MGRVWRGCTREGGGLSERRGRVCMCTVCACVDRAKREDNKRKEKRKASRRQQLRKAFGNQMCSFAFKN